MLYNPEFYQRSITEDTPPFYFEFLDTTPAPDRFLMEFKARRHTDSFVQSNTSMPTRYLGQETRYYKYPVPVAGKNILLIDTSQAPDTILQVFDMVKTLHEIVFAPDPRQQRDPKHTHDIWGYF